MTKNLLDTIMDVAQDDRISFGALYEQVQAAVADRAADVKKNSDDYTPEEYDYWMEQAHETSHWQLQLLMLDEAAGRLGSAISQALPKDDQIIIENVRQAHALLEIVRKFQRSLNSSTGRR